MMLIAVNALFSLLVSSPTLIRPAQARQLPAIVMQGTFMSKVKELNSMNKMSSVKKNQKPMASPKKLTPKMIEVTETKFKKTYDKKSLELLWGALLQIYGSVELAEKAVLANPQVLNPSYSFCNTMIVSKNVLVDMMGTEEALEVMLKNPAVLQCGPALDTLGPDEIKGFANLRSTFNNIPENVRGYALLALLAFVLFPIFASNNELLQDSAALNIAKIGNGVLFAVLIEGSRIIIFSTILKGKLSGDERVLKAQENELKRMGRLKKS